MESQLNRSHLPFQFWRCCRAMELASNRAHHRRRRKARLARGGVAALVLWQSSDRPRVASRVGRRRPASPRCCARRCGNAALYTATISACHPCAMRPIRCAIPLRRRPRHKKQKRMGSTAAGYRRCNGTRRLTRVLSTVAPWRAYLRFCAGQTSSRSRRVQAIYLTSTNALSLEKGFAAAESVT